MCELVLCDITGRTMGLRRVLPKTRTKAQAEAIRSKRTKTRETKLYKLLVLCRHLGIVCCLFPVIDPHCRQTFLLRASI